MASAAGPAAAGSAGEAERSRLLPVALLALWAAGALAVLATLLTGALRLRWLARRASRVTSGPLWRASRRASLRLRLDRTPRLLVGDDTAMPMTWGWSRPVVLLPAGAEAWDPRRLETVLLHELGHAKRADYRAQVLARLACALYWFDPLAWIAAHRMRVEREHACDDLVISCGHDASSYADELLRLARSFRSSEGATVGALAIVRRNRLKGRIVALLDPARVRKLPTRRVARAAAAVAAALTLGIAGIIPASGEAATRPAAGEETPPTGGETPAGTANFGAPPLAPRTAPEARSDLVRQEGSILCGPADGAARRRASMSRDGVRTIEAEYGRCRSEVRIEGDIAFTEDFRGIARISPGGLLRIEVRREDGTRRFEARPGSGGDPSITWTLDGDARAFDASGRAWLAGALLDLFRSSDYMAAERVAWILERDGTEGVFAEVDVMPADHARAAYLALLLERPDLSAQEVRRTLDVAGREVDSDHALGEVLIAAAERHPFDAATRGAFLEAASSLESDHRQGEVFLTALSRGDLSIDDLDLLLRSAAASIGSDHTLGEILVELASRYVLDPRLRDPYLRAAATLDSDHTAGEVYAVLLAQPELGAEDIAAVLEAAGRIGSDHRLAELLIGAAGRGLSDGALQQAYLDAAAKIGSDHARSEALEAFMMMDGLSAAAQVGLLRTARTIGSDHTLSGLLVAFAERHPVQGLVREAFLETLDEIDSDHARDRVTRALERR
ncbi:MAG: M56 family metallopeptidase [Gemmatimonadota bacterium]|nr:M56 family metallopeptidase [Gemmatimonadota bacterium]